MTDANLRLGALHPTHLLGGQIAVRRDLAAAAIGKLAAQPVALPDGPINQASLEPPPRW